MQRRTFIKSLAALSLPAAGMIPSRARAALTPDPERLLDLAPGFGYTIVSRAGTTMSDGFVVPPAHDGMAAFPGRDGRVVLVCNHELPASRSELAAFDDYAKLPEAIRTRLYDGGGGVTPGAGGTTTTVWNPASGKTERQHLSLGGTEVNCAGGPTPWGSWLTCEECFENPGSTRSRGRLVTREKRHGYVFEVPAAADGLVQAVPIEAMGRFEHEAAAIHEATGIVYMTEDRHHSLFYRFLPDVPGQLLEGGRLQALAVRERPTLATHNWAAPLVLPGQSLEVEWIDLDDVDPDENDLRLRGAARGAATFARGEGLSAAGTRFAFTCTIGGPARLGQVWSYAPSPFEGSSRETDAPGTLTLLAEADETSLLRNADNLTFAPWGDLIICEDTKSQCSLVGLRPDGESYLIADNAYSDSELAGVCFAPDGKTLFVNIQYPGTTVAITGPWHRYADTAG